MLSGPGKCERCCCCGYLHSNIPEPHFSNWNAGLHAYRHRSYSVQWSQEEKQMRILSVLAIFCQVNLPSDHFRTTLVKHMLSWLIFILPCNLFIGNQEEAFLGVQHGPMLQSGEIYSQKTSFASLLAGNGGAISLGLEPFFLCIFRKCCHVILSNHERRFNIDTVACHLRYNYTWIRPILSLLYNVLQLIQ